jgi:hypothetical protein
MSNVPFLVLFICHSVLSLFGPVHRTRFSVAVPSSSGSMFCFFRDLLSSVRVVGESALFIAWPPLFGLLMLHLACRQVDGAPVLQTGLRNKNSLEHMTVGTSPDMSRDLGSPSGLCNQSPDRSHARSHVQSHAKSLTKSTALVPGHGPLRDERTGPEIITSRLSFEDAIREPPLVRGSRIIPTHRPDGSHKRENGAHG